MNSAPAEEMSRPWLTQVASCPSTNSQVLSELDRFQHGDCLSADVQTAGRGRGDHRWHSPSGNVAATWVIDVDQAHLASRLSLTAGLAVAFAVEDLCPGHRVALKWPNDCLLADTRQFGPDTQLTHKPHYGKLAGILCESRMDAGKQRVAVGIGINLKPDWQQSQLDPYSLPAAERRAISLADVDQHPDRLILMDTIRRYLLEAVAMLDGPGWHSLLDHWRERDALKGLELIVDQANRRLRGLGAGIGPEGELLLHTTTGIRACSSGSVSLA